MRSGTRLETAELRALVGKYVILRGLESRPLLNGERVRVVSYLEKDVGDRRVGEQRLGVQLLKRDGSASGKPFSVKVENTRSFGYERNGPLLPGLFRPDAGMLPPGMDPDDISPRVAERVSLELERPQGSLSQSGLLTREQLLAGKKWLLFNAYQAAMRSGYDIRH